MSNFLHIQRWRMEKGIGVKKEIDRLGRLVIPKEMRATLQLGDVVELVMTDEGVLVRNPEFKLVPTRTEESGNG